MLRKTQIGRDIEDIRTRFFLVFSLLVIAETTIRLIICMSFPNKLYALSLAGILFVHTFLYVFFVKKALKRTYAIGIVLFIFALTHFVYVIGTYSLRPIMILWFLVIPIVSRIYYSNKVSIIVAITSAIVVVLITKLSVLTGVLDHYKEIVLDYYGEHASEFIFNFFIALLFLYIILSVYYLMQVLIINYANLTEKYTVEKEIEEPDKDLPQENVSEDPQSIRDIRLQAVYLLITDHLKNSECYLNPEYTLAQLAIDLKVNRTTISNSLNGAGGIFFKNLLNQYRIDKAKELFRKDTFQLSNIKETYMNVGFKYHTTFNRAFKKQEGITPTEYIIKIKNCRRT